MAPDKHVNACDRLKDGMIAELKKTQQDASDITTPFNSAEKLALLGFEAGESGTAVLAKIQEMAFVELKKGYEQHLTFFEDNIKSDNVAQMSRYAKNLDAIQIAHHGVELGYETSFLEHYTTLLLQHVVMGQHGQLIAQGDRMIAQSDQIISGLMEYNRVATEAIQKFEPQIEALGSEIRGLQGGMKGVQEDIKELQKNMKNLMAILEKTDDTQADSAAASRCSSPKLFQPQQQSSEFIPVSVELQDPEKINVEKNVFGSI